MLNKRILVIASYAPSLINFRGPMISDLIAAGYNVFAASPDIDDETHKKIIALGATPIEAQLARKGLNPIADLSYCYDLYKIIKNQKIDLILSYTAKPNIWGAIAGKMAGIKSISMLTGLGIAFTPDGNWKPKISALIIKKLYALATSFNSKVVFQNQDDMIDFIKEKCLTKPEKAVLVNGSGVDLTHYMPAPMPEKPIFFMISRIIASKGVRDYANAAIKILKKRNDCRFILLGVTDNGHDAIPLEEIAQWQKDGLEYHGPVLDIRIFMKSCSIYVLPSYREGTPRSVLEAMAMRRPIITTDAPGCRETVQNGCNGYLVPVNDVDKLVIAMEKLADNPQKRDEMGAESLKIAIEKYDVVKINAILTDMIGNVIYD